MSATGTPAGTAMRADARRNRQRLLDAALQVYAERGADDASLDEIARRAGVGIGTLYRHFPTRRALLEAVYRDQVEDLCQAAREQPGEAPEQTLERWLRALMAFATTKKNLSSSLMSGPEKSEVATSCSAMVREAATRLLAEAQRTGHVRGDVDAIDLMRMSHALAIAADLPHSHPDQSERLMSVLLAGLRPQPADQA
ncbi:MAG TPA: helix-turn-helix domain-containing protein [Streptosporangiaceae bacterium]|jgi:AcrR family transcriptional regulator